MSALVKRLRPKPRTEPFVRFDGLPGEYAQFDFGECVVPFVSTGKERVQFFAGRLKFSRYMHVVLVPDQQAETLVRSLFACLVEFGGSPKEWVFDNPRTVRISPIGAEPVVLHRYLRQAVAECRVIPTLARAMRSRAGGGSRPAPSWSPRSEGADARGRHYSWPFEVGRRANSDALARTPEEDHGAPRNHGRAPRRWRASWRRAGPRRV